MTFPTNSPELGTATATGPNASEVGEVGKKDDMLLLGAFPYGKTVGEAEMVGVGTQCLKLAKRMAMPKTAYSFFIGGAMANIL